MRQAGSRASQALWALMHKGSKYADRMPIGLESIIKNVSASRVKNFYNKWYHPAHMAVVVVGDFDVRSPPTETCMQCCDFPAAVVKAMSMPSCYNYSKPAHRNTGCMYSLSTVSASRN